MKNAKFWEGLDLSGKKKLMMVLLVVLLFGAVAAGVLYHNAHYTMVDFQFYPKDATALDLRGQDISIAHYEKLSRRMPQVEVRWDVPLSSGIYADDAAEITLSSLTKEDVKHMDHLTVLEVVDARSCQDYDQLLALMERRPEVEVRYTVTIGGADYPQDTTRLEVQAFEASELDQLQYLTALETVICTGGEASAMTELQAYCKSHSLDFGVEIGGTAILDTEKNVTLEQAGEADLALLGLLTEVESIHLERPNASAESLLALWEQYPEADISWSMEILGEMHSTQEEELDLSNQVITSIEEVETALRYFPGIQTVFLGQQNLDNEELAAYRDRVRDQYKVVWVVQLGNKLTSRTDATTFMPLREKVFYFLDDEAYNLRYCEDMVCLDIGHMAIRDLTFLEYMPHLKYLILAHTEVTNIESLRHCKELVFLELDWSCVKDYSPLVDCTALEDLNLGKTYCDITPILEMTWLKNLWMIDCGTRSAYIASQNMPETTTVTVSGTSTVGSGWRNLPNYYAMRDLLGMEYMS